MTAEVLDDLSAGKPMMRLLQGDVGAGKTVVAAFAAVRVAEHDRQTALMVPTEILAEQHFETLSAWLSRSASAWACSPAGKAPRSVALA